MVSKHTRAFVQQSLKQLKVRMLWLTCLCRMPHCTSVLCKCVAPPLRAAHKLWSGSIYEYQCIDVSEEVEKVARLLRQGEG